MSKILLYLGNLYFINGKTGVGAYQGNIIGGLDQEYDIVVPNDYEDGLPSNAHPIKISNFKRKLISLTKRFLPINCFFKGYDYLLTGGFCFKKTKKTIQYNIAHDFMPFTEPECYTFKQRLFSKIEASSYKNADKIIAVSQTTKQVAHDLFGIPFSKLPVCTNITEFYIKNTPTDYFLFIGDMRPNKNLLNLILGYYEYLNKYNGSEKLIIAGNKKFEFDNLQKLVNKLNISEKVLFPGYVSEEDKVKLFEGAKALAFLSDNEGFGIPLLEAGVNGIPSLCSDIPVFHEVVNEELAVFVDNKDINKIAEGFFEVNKKLVSESASEKLKVKYSREQFNKSINELFR